MHGSEERGARQRAGWEVRAWAQQERTNKDNLEKPGRGEKEQIKEKSLKYGERS